MIAFPVKGLTEEENKQAERCFGQLIRKRSRAVMRSNFYNTKDQLDKVGFSIPPSMASLEAVLGWPTKAVDALSGRLKLHGFVQPGKKGLNEDIDFIFSQNRMAIEWPQTQISTFIHGCSFVAATPGDTSEGEPEVMIQAMPATEASGIWNVRKRQLDCAIWVPDCDAMLSRTAVLFFKNRTVTMTRDAYGGDWEVKFTPNKLPRVPVTLVAHRGQLTRPFGSSRLSRAVIYLCQMGARTLLRTEVGAEFYSSPQRYAMGATAEDFQDENGDTVSAWDTVLGKTWLIGRDEDTGELPTIGQFPQATMQPHVEMMRMITTLFAGETSLPVGSLGVIHDNPASAAAIDAAWADMVQKAEECQVELGGAAIEIAQNALMIKNGQTSLPDELVRLRAKWQNASTPTIASQADAVSKMIGSGQLQADSVVGLEKAGFDETDIERITAEHAAAKEEAAKQMAALGGTVNGVTGGVAGNGAAGPNQPAAGAKPGVPVAQGVAGARPGPPR